MPHGVSGVVTFDVSTETRAGVVSMPLIQDLPEPPIEPKPPA